MKSRLKPRFFSPFLLWMLAGCAGQTDPAATVKREGKPDVVKVSQTDAEMEKAMETARKTVNRFISALKKPKPGQVDFAIKKPFPHPDGAEHIWISDLTFDGKNFKGRIANDPVNIKGVKAGDSVTVGQSEISDWNYIDNGKLVGGETIRVLYKRLPEAEKQDFRAQTGFKF